ncbi:MAG: glutathione S-transferase family protein [Polyangiaceae bacterium]
MTKPKLTYFDAAASRGEECRLALHVAGVEFEDVRIKREDWPALKPRTPFGGLPMFEVAGKPVLAESNAILVYIGRTHDLHPKDAFEAARHEAILSQVEVLRTTVGRTLRMSDAAEKKVAREDLAANFLPTWGQCVERQLGDGPFFAGAKIHVADIKLYMGVRWFANGTVDHVPATIFSPYAKLTRLFEAVRDHAGVKAWYART